MNRHPVSPESPGGSHRGRLARSLCVSVIVAAALVVSIVSLALAVTTEFPDVSAAHPYYQAINDLASKGVIGGYTDGNFGPNDLVKRQQFAKMAVLAGGYPVSESDVCAFLDVDKSDGSTYFPDNFIAVCASKGITTGKTATTFDPYKEITRLQVISMVVRMADDLQPGLLAGPQADWAGSAGWGSDPTHGTNALRAEHNGLLAGLDLDSLSPSGFMTRGEVAQVLYNLLNKLSGTSTSSSESTTTTAAPTTTTTELPNTWTDLKPRGSLPAARFGSLMVYDPAKGAVVLFGGAETGRAFNDTWAYDPAANAWTALKPAGSLPSARAYHAMVYDSVGGKVILFGGTDDNDVSLSDTWAYDPAANTWTDLNPGGSSPPGRYGHSMVYDSATGKVILFGGWGADDAIFNDTWAYDPAANTWSELHPAGSLPTARAYFGMAYDSVTGKVFLFGGMGSGGDKKFDDTWAYDPAANAWTALKPAGASPSTRCCHFMVYNSATGKVLLFGGLSDDRRALSDTWAYDPAANTWAYLQPTGSTPPARTAHRMAYDSETGMVFLFGGYGYDSALLNDTWVYGR